MTRLNAAGSGLVYSTFIGGSDWDRGFAIAVDGSGHAYVTGETSSTDFPVTAGAFQTTYGGGVADVFVAKLCMDVSPSCSPLSGAQLSLGVRKEGLAVHLSWRYLGERQPERYELWRVRSGIGPSRIDLLGTQEEYVDKGCRGRCEYQVRGYFSDGREVQSEVVWVEMPEGVGVYPNPSVGGIWLSEGGVYEVWGSTGQLVGVWEAEVGGGWVELPRGMYFLRERCSGTVQRVVVVE